MKFAITGGTGFIGKYLTSTLKQQHHDIIILTRSESKTENGIQYVQWLKEGAKPENELEGVDVIINLAGVSLNEGRWTQERKVAIYDSRIDATKEVLRIIEALDQKPKTLINASAIGLYPASKAALYTEKSDRVAKDFLGKTVHDWEALANRAKNFGVRVAFTRFGVILGEESGAFPLLALPAKLYVGGKLGSGMQWISWVHVEDVARAIAFVAQNEAIEGPVNVTAPFPIRMKQMNEAIAKKLDKPYWFPVPESLLKLTLGEKSQLVVEGQRVIPEVLLENEFEFRYRTINEALNSLL